jgi:hypothetical protein
MFYVAEYFAHVMFDTPSDARSFMRELRAAGADPTLERRPHGWSLVTWLENINEPTGLAPAPLR